LKQSVKVFHTFTLCRRLPGRLIYYIAKYIIFAGRMA
jgi:hypothetical protein